MRLCEQKENRDHRSACDEKPHPYAAVDTAKAGGIGLRGAPQREEHIDDLREVREDEVQVRKEGILDKWLLYEHGRCEQEGSAGVHPEPRRRGHYSRSVELPGV